MEAKIRRILSVEEWDDHFAREEENLDQWPYVENLEQRKLQFEAEDLDMRRRFEQHLQEREAKLEEEQAWLAQEQSEVEKKMEIDRIRLAQREAEVQRMAEEFQRDEREFLAVKKMRQREIEKKREDDWMELARWEAELQRRLEEVEREERELNIREEELNKFEVMQMERLQQPDRCKNKNYNAWALIPIICVLAVASGFTLLVEMCTRFPVVCLQYIVHTFAVLWVLGSAVLPFRIFERFRGQKTLRHCAARLAFMRFTLGMYALYLVSRHLDGIFSRASPP